VIVPPECTGWVASAGVAQAHAEFDDGKRLHASGTHPEMGAGEKMAALMECIAGVRPWRQHLELAADLMGLYKYVSAPPADRENRFGGSPDQLLGSMILELGTASVGSQPQADREAFPELVRWHFQELDFRARTFARAEARVAHLTVDRRAGALRASKLWEAVIEARLEAAERLSAFSSQLSAGRARFEQVDIAPPAIQLDFKLDCPEGWSADEFETLTDRFMISRTMQRTFLAYGRGATKSDAETSRSPVGAQAGGDKSVRARSEIGIRTGSDLGSPNYA
jgi:hypothetical protein